MHATHRFSQRALLWAFSVTLALGLAACSSEQSERKAFINFLQTRIIDKPGVHLPIPTAADQKSFGEYGKHLAVITDFNTAMDSKVTGPMRELTAKGMPKSMPEIMARRADLATLRENITIMGNNVGTELAKADAQRAALKQPDDLKLVYDKAYARTVTDPANMIKEFMPALQSTLLGAEKLADFLEAHKAQIKINGGNIEITDQKVLDEANVLVSQMTAKSNEILTAQRKMNAVMTGH